MSQRRMAIVYSVVASLVVVATAAYFARERLHFVSTCYRNGNTLHGCSCTFSALPQLSSTYRDLARSWAADPTGIYVRSVLYSTAKETLKATTGISKDLVGKDVSAKSYGAWLGTATKTMGWPQTKKMIEGTAQVIATASAAKTVVIPIILAGSDLQNARSTMNEACASVPHFLTPINGIMQSLASAASDSTKWVLDQTIAAGGAASDATVARGNAAIAAAQWVAGWLGLMGPKDSQQPEPKVD